MLRRSAQVARKAVGDQSTDGFGFAGSDSNSVASKAAHNATQNNSCLVFTETTLLTLALPTFPYAMIKYPL